MSEVKSLTEKQAYSAMVFFLDNIYKRMPTDELGGLLGSMSWMGDEEPVDAAYVEEWKQAVQKVLNGEKPFLKLR